MLSWLKRLLGGKQTSGARGESLAADWLRRERGFSIVVRNWRSPHDRRDEIDLVCRDGEALVFVEVKTRSADARVPGVYTVNERKKRVLRRAAEVYLTGLRQKPRTFRLDVVEVSLAKPKAGETDGPAEILHFENVALFSKQYRG
jgi:putative endonuclease